MSEVVDIVQRFSVEVVGADTLKAQTDAFKQQMTAIDELTKKRDILNKFADKDKSPERADKARKAVADLTTQIDRQIAATTRQVVTSQKVQAALTTELGILQKLTDKVNDLMHARERQTTTSGIKQINEELRQTQEELKKLTALDNSGEGSIIGRIFGSSTVGTTGRQLFQGILGGLGIGAGLSIIPQLTAHLVDYLGTQFSTVKSSEILIANNEKLVKTFEDLGQSIANIAERNRLLDIYKSIDPTQSLLLDTPTQKEIEEAYSKTTEGVKRQADAVKALGVVNGEVFEAEKNQFEASQKVRESELSDIERQKAALLSFRDLIKSIQGSASNDALFDNIVTRKQTANKIIDQLNKTDIPDLQKQKIRNELRNSADDRVSFLEVLKKVEQDYNLKLSENLQQELTKRNEISNEELRFTSERNEKIYQLNLQLTERIKQGETAALKDRVNVQQQYFDDVEKLVLVNTRETEDAKRQLQLEKEREIKQLGAVDEEKYQKLLNQIITQGKLREGQIYDAANTRRIEAEKRARDIILSTGITSIGGINSVNAAGGAPNLDQILQQQDLIAQQQRNALAEQRQQAIEAATIKGVDVTNIRKTFDDAQISLDQQQARARLDVQLKYYADLLNLVQAESQRVLNATIANGTNQGANAAAFLSGSKGARGFKFSSQRANYKDSVNNVNGQIDVTTDSLRQANANLIGVRNTPGATTTDISKAEDEVNKLRIALERLHNSKAEIISTEQIRQTDLLINSLKQLGETAVDVFGKISQARQEDLDREIKVREQRIDVALKLAERGNVEALNQEKEALKKAQEQRREDALQQQAIQAAQVIANQSLALSYSILAISKSAAEGGVLAPATIAATVSALAAGVAIVTTIASQARAQRTTGFFKGGFTGEGDSHQEAGVVHKKEFVFNAETTAKYRPLFEAIHKGEGIPMLRMPTYASNNAGGFATKVQVDRLESAVLSVAEAVNGKEVNVSQRVDKGGVAQIVSEQQRADKNKYRRA